MPVNFEAVTFNRGASYRAVVRGQLQRPDFNAKGPALAFASAVHAGTRKPEPSDESLSRFKCAHCSADVTGHDRCPACGAFEQVKAV